MAAEIQIPWAIQIKNQKWETFVGSPEQHQRVSKFLKGIEFTHFSDGWYVPLCKTDLADEGWRVELFLETTNGFPTIQFGPIGTYVLDHELKYEVGP